MPIRTVHGSEITPGRNFCVGFFRVFPSYVQGEERFYLPEHGWSANPGAPPPHLVSGEGDVASACKSQAPRSWHFKRRRPASALRHATDRRCARVTYAGCAIRTALEDLGRKPWTDGLNRPLRSWPGSIATTCPYTGWPAGWASARLILDI